MSDRDTSNIIYRCYDSKKENYIKKSVSVIGLDTEAYIDGKCFLVSTSEGDSFKPPEFPHCLFSRKYRGKVFVTYNLKYD